MNRFVWDLRYSIAAAAGEADDENGMAAQGPQVLPGMYQVRLTVAGKQYTQPLKVMLDPRSAATPADLVPATGSRIESRAPDGKDACS